MKKYFTDQDFLNTLALSYRALGNKESTETAQRLERIASILPKI